MTMETQTDPSREILDHLPQKERSLFTNIALDQVRGGIAATGAIVAGMAAEYRRRAAAAVRYGNPFALEAARRGVAVIHDHPDAVLAFAAWAILWDELPPEERVKRKATQAKAHVVAWTRSQPPTVKQITYVRALGWTGEIESRAHASLLIDALKTPGRSR